MSSADLATVIIACPTCGTRYQVPYGALGAAGRDVQCAQCGNSWRAKADAPPPPPVASPPAALAKATAPADPDRLFSADEESALDAAFEDEAASAAPPKPPAALPQSIATDPNYERTLAEIRAAIAPKPKPGNVNAIDPAQLKKTETAFAQRQLGIAARLPIARLRRSARLGALGALVAVLILGFALRTYIVTWFPQLAGLYAAIGLPVNIVGLQFEDAKTLTSLRDGKTVMQVSARIRSIANHTVDVPPVLVTLLDANGASVYAWTVAPQTRSMDPGDLIDFVSEVNAPPDTAVTAQLSFTNAGGGLSAPPAPKAP